MVRQSANSKGKRSASTPEPTGPAADSALVPASGAAQIDPASTSSSVSDSAPAPNTVSVETVRTDDDVDMTQVNTSEITSISEAGPSNRTWTRRRSRINDPADSDLNPELEEDNADAPSPDDTNAAHAAIVRAAISPIQRAFSEELSDAARDALGSLIIETIDDIAEHDLTAEDAIYVFSRNFDQWRKKARQIDTDVQIARKRKLDQIVATVTSRATSKLHQIPTSSDEALEAPASPKQ